jgi:hypothetical protein
MKSEWRILQDVKQGKKVYQVYRLLDKKCGDHTGNREEYGNCSTSKAWATKQASKLNQRKEV